MRHGVLFVVMMVALVGCSSKEDYLTIEKWQARYPPKPLAPEVYAHRRTPGPNHNRQQLQSALVAHLCHQ